MAIITRHCEGYRFFIYGKSQIIKDVHRLSILILVDTGTLPISFIRYYTISHKLNRDFEGRAWGSKS